MGNDKIPRWRVDQILEYHENEMRKLKEENELLKREKIAANQTIEEQKDYIRRLEDSGYILEWTNSQLDNEIAEHKKQINAYCSEIDHLNNVIQEELNYIYVLAMSGLARISARVEEEKQWLKDVFK